MRLAAMGSLCLLLAASGVAFADPPAAPPTFSEQVNRHFAKWDRNSDDALSLEEINKAVIDPAVQGPEAAAVAALRRFVRNAKTASTGLTREEISKSIGKKLDSVDDEQAKEKGSLAGYYNSALARLAKVDRELFPKGRPTFEAVHQGKLGDCFCLAPLGSMCSRDPEELVHRIAKKSDGTYDVRIGKETFNVVGPTDAEIALSASAEGDGIWVNVYEKAVGAMKMKVLPSADRPITSLDIVTKGGSAGTMMGALTGHPIERFSLTLFHGESASETERDARLKELREKLVKAFDDKKLVTTGTNKNVSPKPPSINGNHAYAILGYDSKTDRIQVWNPHGQTFTPKGPPSLETGYATSKGKFEMPLGDFVKVFAGLAFEVLDKK
jgi:Calpain family cysteine protease